MTKRVTAARTNVKTMDDLLKTVTTAFRTFRRGDFVEGTVISKGTKIIFVDLGAKSEGIIGGRGFEGEFERAKDLQVGDKVLGVVVQSEDDQGYIVLSLSKAAPELAWRRATAAFKADEILEVRVVDSNRGGLVVEWVPTPSSETKLHGFVPFSHLDARRFDSGSPGADAVAALLGQTLKVKVIELDRANSRLVFSEKKANVNEAALKEFFARIKNKKKVSGTVGTIFTYGVLVKLDKNVEGLLHIRDMDWVRVEDPGSYYRVGDSLEVEVLGFDEEEGRLRLSTKTLKKNPWEKLANKYQVGDRVSGEVTKIVPFGAFVRLEEGIEGLIHVSETTGPLTVGERIEAVIITLEPEKQKLGLSVKKLK